MKIIYFLGVLCIVVFSCYTMEVPLQSSNKYKLVTFKQAGFSLHKNCSGNLYAQLIYKNTDLYAYWDFHEKCYTFELDLAKIATVRMATLLNDICAQAKNFLHVLKIYGFKQSHFVGKNKEAFLAMLKKCKIVEHDGRFVIDTETMFDDVGNDSDLDHNRLQQSEGFAYSDDPCEETATDCLTVYKKPTVFEKLQYTILGFALALPCFYIWNWKFTK